MPPRSARLLVAALLATTPVSLAAAPTSGVTSGLLTSAKPGDDFDAYANGGWRNATEIPADKSRFGVFDRINDVAEKRTAELIQAAGAAKGAAGTPNQMIGDYYAAYMDEAGIAARGTAPLQPLLAEVAAINDRTSLARYFGSHLRADVDPLNSTNFSTPNLFGLFVAQGLEDPSRNAAYLLQGGLSLPDREYFVGTDPHMKTIQAAFRAYVEKMFTLAGVSDAAARADRVMTLETKIAEAHLDREASEDVHKADNPWTVAELKATAPGLDWTTYLAAAHLDQQPVIYAWQPTAIAKLSALTRSEPLESWKDLLTFQAINRAAAFLPPAFVDARFDMYGHTLSGALKNRDRWKRGVSSTNAALGDAVGQVYVAHYFPPAAKQTIQTLVGNIVDAYRVRISRLDWMTPATKAKAEAKLDTLIVGVGYPETWRDYRGLVVKGDDPLGNSLRAEQWETQWQLAKLAKPVDRHEWWMTPQTVNAVNLPLQNALNFPAAILSPPFFDPNQDPAANYGSIGAVIGHEISHSFDNTGAEFDSTGKLANWWTPADQAHFKASGQALADQYDAYEPLPGLHVKGQQTLGENIADVAGLAAAHDAYLRSLGGKPAPVIDGMTGEQRFFLAFAQSWREKEREAALRQGIVTDGHAPASTRAQTVRNLDAWYDAFGVKPGDKLYLPPEKRVRIW